MPGLSIGWGGEVAASDLVDIARGVLIPLALYCVSWSWTGPAEVMRGMIWPVSLYRSCVFCLGVFTLGFQITHFTNAEEVGSGPWALLWLMIAICAHGFAVAGRFSGHFQLGENFYSLLLGGHLRVALAMADYHAAFPEEAEALADKLNKLTAAERARDAR